MKIATWNINGIKARHDTLIAWLEQSAPDVACLQEIKSIDENFPREAIENLGYNIETHGQKGFNGVALLSKYPMEDVTRGLPLIAHHQSEPDPQARFIHARINDGIISFHIASLYLPNGNPVNSEKYPYKLAWMQRLHHWTEQILSLQEPLILAGDYNIIPEDKDAAKPQLWHEDALAKLESRAAYQALVNLGLYDALRSTTDADQLYTFWDYQAGAWQKNNGIRIDHCLLSARAHDCLTSVQIDKYVRGWEKPSDHVPLCITLKSAVS
jgi:exodeoxyribonuclease-3